MDLANAEARAKREIGQTVAGRYRLEALLEFADTTASYRAVDPAQGACAVTLYQLDLGNEEARQRFEQATRAVLSLSNPHVLPALAAGRDEALGPYLVTSLSTARSLRDVIDETRALGSISAVRIALQAGLGLAAAHSLGLVHGDIQPKHVLFAPEGGELIVKLKHFAVAAPFTYSREEALTRTSSHGAPDYAAPEQLRRPVSVDQRSDVWSLAAVLYEALSGVTPFSHAESIAELIHAICNEDVPELSGRAPWLEPELAATVHRALNRDPAQRPTMTELGERLRRFSGGDPHLDEALLAPISSDTRSRVGGRGELQPSAATEPVLAAPTPRSALEVKVDISPLAAAGMANLKRGGRGGTSLPPERVGQGGPRRRGSVTNSWLVMILLIVVAGGLSMALGYALHRH